jgi:hypothetical protein
MGKTTEYRMSVRTPFRKLPLGRLRSRWDNCNKMIVSLYSELRTCPYIYNFGYKISEWQFFFIITLYVNAFFFKFIVTYISVRLCACACVCVGACARMLVCRHLLLQCALSSAILLLGCCAPLPFKFCLLCPKLYLFGQLLSAFLCIYRHHRVITDGLAQPVDLCSV